MSKAVDASHVSGTSVIDLPVRRAKNSDVPAIVAVHRATFRGYMNTMLGRAYLHDFYRWFMEVEEGFLLVVHRDGRITGFVAGADIGYDTRMNRDLLWAGVRGILLHPRLWIHPNFRRTVGTRLGQLFRRPALDIPDPMLSGRGISLVGIAVSPEAQGTGAGRLLMEAFEGEARRREADYVRLSVYDTNASAKRVYERQGWTRSSERDGTLVYAKRLRV